MSKKEAYQQKLQANLDEINAEIDKLRAIANKKEANTKIKFYEQIDDLKAKHANTKSKLADLKDASDDAWEDIKQGADNAWQSLGDAVKSAHARFKQ